MLTFRSLFAVLLGTSIGMSIPAHAAYNGTLTVDGASSSLATRLTAADSTDTDSIAATGNLTVTISSSEDPVYGAVVNSIQFDGGAIAVGDSPMSASGANANVTLTTNGLTLNATGGTESGIATDTNKTEFELQQTMINAIAGNYALTGTLLGQTVNESQSLGAIPVSVMPPPNQNAIVTVLTPTVNGSVDVRVELPVSAQIQLFSDPAIINAIYVGTIVLTGTVQLANTATVFAVPFPLFSFAVLIVLIAGLVYTRRKFYI